MNHNQYGGMNQFFMSGVPHRPAFTPQVPARANMQTNVTLVHGHLVAEIQARCQENPMREQMFWEFSQNGYANNQYAEFLLTVLDYVEFLMATGYNLQQSTQQAVGEMCAIRAAMIASSSPSYQQQLSPEVAQNVRQLLGRYDQIAAAVSQYLQQNPDMGMQNWGNQAGGFPTPVGGGYGGPGMGMGNGQPVGFPNRGPAPHSPGGYDPRAIPRHVAGSNHSVFNGGNNTPSTGSPSQPRGTGLLSVIAKKSKNEESKENTVQNTQTQPAPVETPAASEPTFIDVIVPRKGQRPMGGKPFIPTLFDPATHVAVFERQGNIDVEKIIPIEESGVDYQKHETEYLFDPVIPTKGEVERKREAMAKSFRETVAAQDVEVYLSQHEQDSAGISDISEEAGEDIRTALKIADDDLLVENEQFADLALLSYAAERGWNDDMYKNRCIRYRYTCNRPVVLSGEDMVLYMEISQATNYGTLTEKVTRFIQQGHPALARSIDEMVTDHINEILTREMGLEITIDSFLADIEDLRKVIRDDYGEDLLEEFDRTARDIARQDFHHVCAAAVYGADGEDDSSLADSIVPVMFGVNVHLRIDGSDFCASTIGNFGVVRESLFPELHQALETIWEDVTEKTRRVRLICADGSKILVHKSRLGDNFVVGPE